MTTKGLIFMFNLCTTLIMTATGCNNNLFNPGTPGHGTTWIVPGIEGQAVLVKPVISALRDSGYKGDIKSINWGSPLLPFRNLCNKSYKALKSKELTNEIARYAQSHPNQPINIIGYSAGAGLATMAVEQIPDNIKINNLTLVHGALSPKYDLTKAISKTSGKIKNVCSSADWLILGLGTSIFGTMDNTHTSSAGMVGFDPETAIPNPAQRLKLQQVKWNLSQKRWGGHTTIYSYNFNKDYVIN